MKNASFRRGNALKLDFPDESFDAVTRNYVYHNITGADKQALLLETLRVLKKGGTFAIHDLMSPGRYGDMQAFVQKLRDMGYERVKLIDTTDGRFMTPKDDASRFNIAGGKKVIGAASWKADLRTVRQLPPEHGRMYRPQDCRAIYGRDDGLSLRRLGCVS